MKMFKSLLDCLLLAFLWVRYAILLSFGVVAYTIHGYFQHINARLGLVLYANTITNLIPTLYEALDVVSRELVGFIPAVNRNSNAERIALNQTVNIPVVPAIVAANVTPGVTAPNDGDATIGNTTMTISKSRYAPIRWNAEEQKAIALSGMSQNVVRDQFAQAMRVLVNEVEADLAGLYVSASRAFGIAGTPPFPTAGDFSDFAQTLKILDDNGAPGSDRQLVLGTSAIANLRGKQNLLFKANEAGTTDLLRLGILGMVEGYQIHATGGIKSTAKGTGAAYTTNTAGYAVGATVITLITGTGTVLAGDNVTFAGDTNIYVVETGVAAPGAITLAQPGLRIAIPTSATALTVGTGGQRNMAFSRSAMHLLTRVPALPQGGDMADDVLEIQDPVSGLAFQVCVYRQYKQVRWEVGMAWGVKATKSEHITILLG